MQIEKKEFWGTIRSIYKSKSFDNFLRFYIIFGFLAVVIIPLILPTIDLIYPFGYSLTVPEGFAYAIAVFMGGLTCIFFIPLIPAYLKARIKIPPEQSIEERELELFDFEGIFFFLIFIIIAFFILSIAIYQFSFPFGENEAILTAIVIISGGLLFSYFLKSQIKKPNSMIIDHNLLNFYQIEDLDLLDGIEFEGFLGVLFKKMGYSVTHTPPIGDQGADLIVEHQGLKIVVQAKNHASKISNKAVQEVVASIKYYSANKAMVVANSYFTTSAIELARINKVELWDRKRIIDVLKEYPVSKNET